MVDSSIVVFNYLLNSMVGNNEKQCVNNHFILFTHTGRAVVYTITGRSNLFNTSHHGTFKSFQRIRRKYEKEKNVCTQKSGHTQKKKTSTHRQKLLVNKNSMFTILSMPPKSSWEEKNLNASPEIMNKKKQYVSYLIYAAKMSNAIWCCLWCHLFYAGLDVCTTKSTMPPKSSSEEKNFNASPEIMNKKKQYVHYLTAKMSNAIWCCLWCHLFYAGLDFCFTKSYVFFAAHD